MEQLVWRGIEIPLGTCSRCSFLDDPFKQGYQYRSLNEYRSAICCVHENVDEEEVSKHTLTARVLKGAFNERPPQPMYTTVWQVDSVVDWFRSVSLSALLSLHTLTIKMAMLLVLTRPCRGADLAALSQTHRSFVPQV